MARTVPATASTRTKPTAPATGGGGGGEGDTSGVTIFQIEDWISENLVTAVNFAPAPGAFPILNFHASTG
jgi:hypothetical protein